MKRAARFPAAALASALALLLLGQCRRADVAPPETTSTVSDGARAMAEPPRAPPPPAPAAESEADVAGPPPSKGAWLEADVYRFRLDDVRKCAPPAVPGGARVGAAVHVTSKVNEVFVAPRDFKLESGGVILDSAILQKAPGGCGPLLTPKSLRAGKTADGVVVFEVPAGFNPEHRPVRITYQPTRWGGAKRVEAVLPEASLLR